MQYQGGKERSAKAIAAFLESRRKPGQLYVEPFVGGASIISRMSGDRIGGDACEALITMYKAIANGWEPPLYPLSKEEWLEIKSRQDHSDPITAYAGFAQSFGGSWFTGYAKGKIIGKDGVLYSRNTLMRKMSSCVGVTWRHHSYQQFSDLKDALIYCDPPYGGTAEYRGIELKWDANLFWNWASEMSQHNTVFVSEYIAPCNWNVVWSKHRRNDHNGFSANVGGPVEDRCELIFECAP